MGYLSGAYKYLTNAVFGGQANIQSKLGSDASFTYLYLKGNYPSGASSQWKNTETAKWEGANGVSCNLLSRTITVDGGDWATASGTIQRATAAKTVSQLDQGDEGQVLTVEKAAIDGGGLVWATPAGDTDNYVSSASFNTGSGIITGTGSGPAGFTVDIDNRYPTYDAGATDYVTYWADANKVTGSTTFQFDGTDVTIANDLSVTNITGSGDLTTSGSIVNKTTTYTTVSPTPAPLLLDAAPVTNAYHVHIINTHDRAGIGGLTQTVELPPASEGREIIITTDCGLTAVGGPAAKQIILTPAGADTINTLLTTTTLNNNGDENFSMYKFMALSGSSNWAGAKMGYVS